MYMGPSTDEPPTPSPPMKRKATRAYQFQAKAQPRPEIKYRTAITRRLSRRPKRSPGKPASIAPRTVPKSALNTVTPSRNGVRLVGLGQRTGSAGDDCRVEAKQKTAQSGHDRALQQGSIQLHAGLQPFQKYGPVNFSSARKPPTSYHRANFNSLDCNTRDRENMEDGRRNGSLEPRRR